jgi:hypothetical protein
MNQRTARSIVFSSRTVALASALILAADPVHAFQGPGTSGSANSTISGELLKKNTYAVTLRTDYTDFEKFTRAESEAHAIQSGHFEALDHCLLTTASIAFGMSDDTEVGASVGYYFGTNFISAQSTGPATATSADADPDGLTDLWLTGKHRWMSGPSGHLALLGGLKLPTGADTQTLSNGQKLDGSSQPGSSAFDFQAGVAYSRELSGRLTLDSSALYTMRGDHLDFQSGDRADLGLLLAYRCTEDVHVFPNYSLSSEFFGVWIEKDSDNGVDNENSGGQTLFFSPGARVRVNERTALSIAPAFPIYQDLNGDQPDTQFKASVTLSMSF